MSDLTSESFTDSVSDDTETIVSETLTGDVRDEIIALLKRISVWDTLSEYQQHSAVSAATETATKLVHTAVRLIAADGRQPIMAKVESVAVKKDIKATLTIAKSDPLRHQLADSTGKEVVLVVADIAPFRGERGAVEITPDEPELPMGEDDKPVFDQTEMGEGE
jgi:hypothetical protein